MHSVSTGSGLNLEAWGVRHPGDVCSREQAQEGGITEGHCGCHMALWNGRSSIGRITWVSVGGCWMNNLSMELCGSNTSEYTLVVIKP